MGRLKHLWFALKRTYWFVPSALVSLSAALAFLLVYVDEAFPAETLKTLFWVHARDPQGARDLLSLIAGSMITVAGVVFSINLVALTLASNQFGTRVLRTFMRDSGSQVTLGVFLGTFLYCVLVMRRIEVRVDGTFIPYVSITVGILFSIASLVVLIYYLHHIVTSVQSENVVAAIEADLRSTIDLVFPDRFDAAAERRHSRQAADFEPIFSVGPFQLAHHQSGYLQDVDFSALVKTAARHDLRVKLTLMPGRFITPGTVLALVVPADRITEDLHRRLRSSFTVGVQRTYSVDVGFGFQQLVYVAVRALSPGLNDHASVTSAIDRICSGLICLGTRSAPSPIHSDKNGVPRLLAPGWPIASIVADLFRPLRFYSLQAPNVALYLHRSLRRTSDRARHPALRDALRRELSLLETEIRNRDSDFFSDYEAA